MQQAKEKHGPQTEFLLVEDNCGGHKNANAMRYCKLVCNTLKRFLVPSTTNYGQLVDDGCGNLFRSQIYDLLDEYLDNFPWQTNPRGFLTASQKRQLLVPMIAKTAKEWNSSEVKKNIALGAAERTGLRMVIDELNSGLKPVRFPADFPASLVKEHPKYNEILPYKFATPEEANFLYGTPLPSPPLEQTPPSTDITTTTPAIPRINNSHSC